jgi:hypothetical protein
MIPVLISALQQMDSTNSNLLARLDKQQKQIDALQNCCTFHSTVSGESPKGNVVDLSDLTIILDQNSPNPFAEQTTITYTIPESIKDAKIMFYTINGVVLKTVQINDRNHGSLTVYGSNLSEGIYTYTLIADGKIIWNKMVAEFYNPFHHGVTHTLETAERAVGERMLGVSEDGKTVSFTKDPNNPDCQKYLEWIAILGNEALPPDPQPE